MTQKKLTPKPLPPKKAPAPPVIDDEDDDFANAGELVITEALDQHAAMPESGGDRADFLKLEEGSNFLRFLPPKPGDPVPWVVTYQHGWGEGKDYRTVNCPLMMAQEECPICAERDKLLATGREADKKSAGFLRPRLRVISEVVNVKDEDEQEKGVQLFAYGKMIHDSLIGILSAGSRMGGDFTHRKTGFPIHIIREGQGQDTKYPTVSATPDRGPIEGSWLLDRADLQRFTELPTRDAMQNALQQLGLRGGGGGGGGRQQRGGRTIEDDLDQVTTPAAGYGSTGRRGGR